MGKRRSTATFAGIPDQAPSARGLKGHPYVRRCAAMNRQGERCGMPAMRGKQVCFKHGGKGGRPVKHGLYSFDMLRLGKEIQEKMQRHLANPDATNLREEIALCRAYLESYLSTMTPSSSKHPPPLPPDFYRILLSFMSRIARLVKAKSEIDWGPQHLITATQAMTFFDAVIDAVFRHVIDVATKEKILADVEATLGLAGIGEKTRAYALPAPGQTPDGGEGKAANEKAEES